MAGTVWLHEWFSFSLIFKELRRCESPDFVGNNVGVTGASQPCVTGATLITLFRSAIA